MINNANKTTAAAVNLNALEHLDAAIQADIDSGQNFGASLLIASHGTVVHRSNFGQACPDRETSDQDRFLLMSMSKALRRGRAKSPAPWDQDCNAGERTLAGVAALEKAHFVQPWIEGLAGTLNRK